MRSPWATAAALTGVALALVATAAAAPRQVTGAPRTTIGDEARGFGWRSATVELTAAASSLNLIGAEVHVTGGTVSCIAVDTSCPSAAGSGFTISTGPVSQGRTIAFRYRAFGDGASTSSQVTITALWRDRPTDEIQRQTAEVRSYTYESLKVGTLNMSLVGLKAALRAEVRAQLTTVKAGYDRNERSLAAAREDMEKSKDKLDSTDKALRALDAQLAALQKRAKAGASDGIEKAEVMLLGSIAALSSTEEASEYRYWQSVHAYISYLQYRAQLQRDLSALQSKLAGLLVRVGDVSVLNGDKVVYRAVATTPVEQLQKLDEDIASLETSLPKLADLRKEALDRFRQSHLYATQRLQNVAHLIITLAAIRHVAELAFLASDLARAAEGGLVGITAEVVRKAFESANAKDLLDGLRPKVGDPNPYSKRVDQLYADSYRAAFTKHSLDNLETRAKKEFINKPIKDKVNQTLGAELFDELNTSWRPILAARAEHASHLDPQDVPHYFDRAQELQDQLKSLTKGPKLSLAALAKKGAAAVAADLLKGYAENIGRDSLKILVRDALEAEERAGWREYVEADLAARAWYAQYQTNAKLYWDAYDRLAELVADRVDRTAEWRHKRQTYNATVDTTFAASPDLHVVVGVDGLDRSSYVFDVLADDVKLKVREVTAKNDWSPSPHRLSAPFPDTFRPRETLTLEVR